jgi:hypothetical protein
MGDDADFSGLEKFLGRIPAIRGSVGKGVDNGLWWVKFSIDIEHPLAWRVVQELGHVLNHLAINERLPTVFMPVSPPVYLNGGPREYLSWVIESKTKDFTPSTCAEWLEGRLPRPVDDHAAWTLEDDGDA